MTLAAGPFAIAALLLALGGALKLVQPADTANALRGVGLPGSRVLVQIGGLVEAVLGVWALLSGAILAAALVGASYLAFVAFVLEARRRDAPIASCGCFGRLDTPPSRLHVVLNTAALGAAIAVAAHPGASLGAAVRTQPLAGVPYVLLVVTGVGLALAALSSLPQTLAVARTVGGRR